jgi:hypothetical protein
MVSGKMSNDPRGARPTDRNETGRRTRVPLGMKQASLVASARPGYQRRWVNDVAGRLQQAIDGGYEHVSQDPTAKSQDLGVKTSRIVGAKEDGQAMSAYLMEIPMDWYEEDQKAKQKPLDEFEAALKGSTIEGGYTPRSGGTRIDRG